MAWLITAVLALGTIWGHRHWVEWMGIRDIMEDHRKDGEEVILVIIGIVGSLLLAVSTWPFLAVFFVLRRLWRLTGIQTNGGRWLEWFYATSREERKEALR